ncbi:MAG: hypothetical protein KAR39_09245 [Thermoplasmata archaeon]|nr:hypothetical protein [Thermoplasmata archaeon]
MNFLLNDGTVMQNVYHHKRGGVGIVGDAEILTTLETWAETMYAEIQDIVHTTVTEQLCFVERIEWDTDKWVIAENIGTFLPLFEPQGVTDPMPNQVSPFVVFKTARPKTVGRKFLFPCNENDQNQGILAAGAVTDIVAYADDAVNNILMLPAATLIPGVPRTGVDAWYEFLVAVVTNLVGTQRRRRPGVGA